MIESEAIFSRQSPPLTPLTLREGDLMNSQSAAQRKRIFFRQLGRLDAHEPEEL
jgi:hypothetical protein